MSAAGLDLAFDDAQQAIAGAVAQFCAERLPDEAVRALGDRFPEAAWRELAELGVLALATPEGEGGACELVAALESLGRAVFPGPLAATFFAGQVLPEAERGELVAGRAVVALGEPPLLPWAPHATVFLALSGETVTLARPVSEVASVATLGGEPWGRVALEPVRELDGADRAHALAAIAMAAYAAAAGLRLVEDTAAHARTRKQFGRAIGEFQAVAHPLAECLVTLSGAATLARAAAFHFDAAPVGALPARAVTAAAAARLSACRAAVDAAHVCHQLFGAVGITLEGPVFHVSRRIRQLASQPPGSAAPREALLAPLGL